MNIVFDRYNIDTYITQKILYEYVENPKDNYDNLIKYLKNAFKRSCSSNCLFRHFTVRKGEIYYLPVPMHHIDLKCFKCEVRYVSHILLLYCERCSINCDVEYNYYHAKCL